MKIRGYCEKCNKYYYGQNLFDFAKNKSEHLKKCGFKIKCDDCTAFIISSPSLSESEEKLKNHQIEECNGSRKFTEMVSCKTLIEEEFNFNGAYSNEGCNKLFVKPSERATEEQMSSFFSKLEKHFFEFHYDFYKKHS